MPTLDTFRPEPGNLPPREDIPSRYTWDLSSICSDWQDWSEHFARLDAAITAFTSIQGKLSAGAGSLLAAFTAMNAALKARAEAPRGSPTGGVPTAGG